MEIGGYFIPFTGANINYTAYTEGTDDENDRNDMNDKKHPKRQ